MTHHTAVSLRRTQFGNPILRTPAKSLSIKQITSPHIQQLIRNMHTTVATKDYGVGLAAPQVGYSYQLSVIDIKPTKRRPGVESFSRVIINPSFEGIGRRTGMWEGCISFAGVKDTVFAKALRYKKIIASWQDETGKKHQETLTGLPAHVFQHEADHLQGILFVERVKDQKTWMNESEYRKRIVKKEKRHLTE